MAKIFGICGKIGSGKSTVSNILSRSYGAEIISFADPLKNICAELGYNLEVLKAETNHNRVLRETIKHPTWGLTGREILQKVGTDLFRDNFDKETWIKLAEHKILNSSAKIIVIPDCRFKNEFDLIKKYNGSILHVLRKNNPSSSDSTHVSETEWEKYLTSNVIEIKNNGSLDDLKNYLNSMVGLLV